jgi:hypothetical protein
LPFRRHLSFANVTASIALFVALGGTGYAAIGLPRNSVGSAQIRRAAVTSAKLHSSAVGRAAIRTGAVGSSEIRTDAVGAPEIRRGAVRTSEIRDGSVTSTDIADGTIAPADLSAATVAGFQAPLLRVAVNKDGIAEGGNAKAATRTAQGKYTVTFDRDVSACFYAATPAAVNASTPGDVDTPDDAATVNVASGGTTAPDNATVLVNTNTFASGALPTDEPFHLLVAC